MRITKLLVTSGSNTQVEWQKRTVNVSKCHYDRFCVFVSAALPKGLHLRHKIKQQAERLANVIIFGLAVVFLFWKQAWIELNWNHAASVEGGHFTKEISRQHCSIFGTSTIEIKEANFLMMTTAYCSTCDLFYDLRVKDRKAGWGFFRLSSVGQGICEHHYIELGKENSQQS
jgi:hypothetical protein